MELDPYDSDHKDTLRSWERTNGFRSAAKRACWWLQDARARGQNISTSAIIRLAGVRDLDTYDSHSTARGFQSQCDSLLREARRKRARR